MQEAILLLIQDYPVAASIFAVMGFLRAVFKPIMSAVETYVLDSESKKDDAKLEKLQANKVYKSISFLLDYTASIKLPQKKKDA